MKVSILIRSYWKDAPWLAYCLRSLKKFAQGFYEIVVVIPTRDHDIFMPMVEKHGARLHQYIVREDKPMIHGMLQVCRADEICPQADFVFFVDSDCVAVENFTPLDYFSGGKPILCGRKFLPMKISSSETERCQFKQWKPVIEAMLGYTATHETNCRVPSVFRRETFSPFRLHVEKHVCQHFEVYAFSCRDPYPYTFLEFGPIGNYILRYERELYSFFDKDESGIQTYADSGPPNAIWNSKFRQFWSHGGLTEEIKKELEAICA